MKKFDNVSVVAKANIYYEGKVTSRTICFADESRKTLGIMLPGEYEFGTAAAEDMEIMAGKMDVLLPGASEWRTIAEGDVFHIPANAKFQVKIFSVVDYCCSYH